MGLTNYPFEFYIGGYPGPFFRLYSLNEKLVAEKHTAFPDPGDQQGYPLTHVVIDLAGNEKWAAMLRYLESRKWKGRYTNTQILDGTNWNLEISCSTVNLSCSGSNRYPPGFKKFLKLLNEVTTEKELTVY